MSQLARKIDVPQQVPHPKAVVAERVGRVDTIRFLCALAVVFSHTAMPYFDYMAKPFKLALSPINWGLMNGPAAVAIFFVISGFSIHWPYRNGKTLTTPVFALSRLVRICLPWLGALGVNALLGCPNIVPQKLVYWSLYAEVIYYLTYPLVLFSVRRFGWSPLFALSCIGSLVVFGIWNRHEMNVHESGIGVTWLLTWPSWLLGVKLASDFASPLNTSRKKLVAFRISVFVASYATLVLNFHSPIRIGLTMNLFAVLVYFWLRHELHRSNESKTYDLLESAGKWSYSLYLVHTPVRYAVEQLKLSEVPQYFLSVGAALVVSYIFYRAVEKPAHALSRYLSRPKSSPLTPRGSPPNP